MNYDVFGYIEPAAPKEDEPKVLSAGTTIALGVTAIGAICFSMAAVVYVFASIL